MYIYSRDRDVSWNKETAWQLGHNYKNDIGYILEYIKLERHVELMQF